MCYCGNTGMRRIPKYESTAQKVDPGERKLDRRSCRDVNPRPALDHKSGALTTELSPLPWDSHMLCVCVCVCAHARACTRVLVCVSACAPARALMSVCG